MGNITILQVVDFIIKLAAFLGACGVIVKLAMYWFTKILQDNLKENLNPFKDKIKQLEQARIVQHQDTIERINNVQLYSDKNFLVRFLADIEQNNKVDEVEKERFYEVYRDYRELGGNSYIQHKVEKLQKEGKL